MSKYQLIFVLLLPIVYSQRVIRVYSDFTNQQDLEFFRTTFPWIVTNLGSDLLVRYYFRNNGLNVGPRFCVLNMMRRNPYLQADYLRCEAQGNSITECRRRMPMNNAVYNRCLRERVSRFMRNSAREFSRLRNPRTPTLILEGEWQWNSLEPERWEVENLDPIRLLNNICWGYGRIRPAGCVNPTPFGNLTVAVNSTISVPNAVLLSSN
ncbi:uncharacterized protein LOC128202216 [Galleria mellonella]|uniref:Uncharacterized protein LOC128202216 n=1 Tax=Galleria mellonella TaxID=7137 RepID=A0ABM3N228_GALME|nr:uncharacterized protein LOC128202216 [Galleria mellonella]